MNKGWIKLHRQIMEHWVFKDPIFFHRWVTLIMAANHSEKSISLGYTIYKIKKGQCCFSLRTWANMFNCGTKQVSKFFDMLESDNMITREIIGKGKQSTTLVNINNYAQFQGDEETQGTTQWKRKGNARGTQLKNEKNEKNINTPVFKEFLSYAKSKKENISAINLKLKYDSWIENEWKDGNNKPIKNWKTKLLNTLPFIEEDKIDRDNEGKNWGKGHNQLRN